MSKEERIYERNTDTDVTRSRKPGDYGNERIESEPIEGNGIRKEALQELWETDKINKDGHWYIKLTDVIRIMGEYDNLYENESK